VIGPAPVRASHVTSSAALVQVIRREDGTAATVQLVLTARSGRIRRIGVDLDLLGRVALISALGGLASHQDLAALDEAAGRPPWRPPDPPHEFDESCEDPACPMCPDDPDAS
jgi:hypothetical protein